jgi:hypothetical protein
MAAQQIYVTGWGTNDNINAQIDKSHFASRVSLRPLDHADAGGIIGGHFWMAATFTNTAAAFGVAGQQLFSVRWADSRLLMVLKRVTIQTSLTTVAAGLAVLDYDIIKATSFSTNPSGGTAISLATTSQKSRSSTMNGSLLATSGAIQISSGAALTPGTQTLDTQPFGYACCLTQTATSPAAGVVYPTPLQSLYELRDFGQHPMIFGANEGFAIRNVGAYQAALVARHGILMVWAEVPSY